MTDPTRPTHAEFEAGHARLRTAWSKRWPELAAYYEGVMRSKIKGAVWTAAQQQSPRRMTIEDLRTSHRASEAASGCAGITTEDEATKVTVRPFNLPFTITHAELEEARVHGVESDAIFKVYYDRMRAAYDRPHGGLEDYFKQAAGWTTDDKEPTT